ncbi:MAG TPA: hypothetical protein VF317_05080, partial [Dermatophilaceae bacterium]
GAPPAARRHPGEDTIRALKNDFGMIHAPVQPFFGNWLYWQAGALAPKVALWLRTLALPRALPPRQAAAAAAGHPQRRRPAGPARPAAAETIMHQASPMVGCKIRA